MSVNNRVTSQMVQRDDVGKMYGGEVLDCPATVQEALQLSGLNFNVGLQNVCTADGTPIPDYYATVREDNGLALGIVKGRYSPMQNMHAFDFINDLVGVNAACITSAGALYGGRKVWVCVDLGAFDILPSDTCKKFLLFVNSHDGSTNIMCKMLAQRLTCQNALTFGANKNENSIFNTKHTLGAGNRLQVVKNILEVSDKNFNGVYENFRQFAQTALPPAHADSLILSSLGVTQKDLKEYADAKFLRSPRWVGQLEEIKHLQNVGRGTDINGVKNSMWGVYNSITEYADWHRSVRNGDNMDVAIDSKLFGKSESIKSSAYETCLEYLNDNSRIIDLKFNN